MDSIKHALVGMLRSTTVNIKLIPYGIRPKTKEDKKNSESNQDRKTTSQVGDVVKQMVEAGSSLIKQHNSAELEDKL